MSIADRATGGTHVKKSLMVAALGIALLAACGKKNDANESSLGEAISADMKTPRGLLCINRSGHGPYIFPSIYSRAELNDYGASSLRAQLGVLEKSGLVSRSGGTSTNVKQNGTVFNLTEQGQKSAVESARRAGDPNALDQGKVYNLCYARVRLDKVVAWTPPDAVAHRSDVTYTYKLEDVASWASDGDVKRAFPEIDAARKEAGDGKLEILLEQRPDGWVRAE
jgi:hypothetical protein